VKTIERGLQNGWSKENIGHHIVRNNTISHCEQTGIVGSLGAVFSTISGNTIHDIHVKRLFTGAEMAGIKLHGAIDVEIRANHIYRSTLGLWLDWMAQGTRVTRNLFDNNGRDLFLEVDHGPFVVDNNLFLSSRGIDLQSDGGAFAHNLILGDITPRPEPGRETPFHKAHSTEVAGLRRTQLGDARYYNNLLVGPANLGKYDTATQPVWMDGNVFLKGAKASKHESCPLVQPEADPAVKLVESADALYLELTLDKTWSSAQTRKLVTTALLGRATVPDLPFDRPDGSPLRISTDYFGKKRNERNPLPGPFELPTGGEQRLKVWPPNTP
jgi:alpha-N-arabinofuranosidase